MRAAGRMRPLYLAVLLLAAVSVPGCGGSRKSTATSGTLGSEASACALLSSELKRFQAANVVAEGESSGTSESMVTSIEAIKDAVKQLANSPDPSLSHEARSAEEALRKYEREGQGSVVDHLTGKQAWKAGTPTLSELCP